MSTSHFPSNNRPQRKGIATLESAIMISVLLLLLLCILDLGIATYRYNLLAESARRVSREAILHGSKATPERESWGPEEISGTVADPLPASDLIRPLLKGFNVSEVEIRVSWLDEDNAPDQRVKVELTYPHRSLIPFPGLPQINLTASSTLRIVH